MVVKGTSRGSGCNYRGFFRRGPSTLKRGHPNNLVMGWGVEGFRTSILGLGGWEGAREWGWVHAVLVWLWMRWGFVEVVRGSMGLKIYVPGVLAWVV